VSFVKLGMWNNGAVNNSLVITGHVAGVMDGHAEIMECQSQEVHDLASYFAGSNEFRTVSSRLDGGLHEGIPVY